MLFTAFFSIPMTTQIYQASLPLYVTEVLGASDASVGFLHFVLMLSMVVGSASLPTLSQKLSFQNIVLGQMLLRLIAGGGYAATILFAPASWATFILLCVWRVLHGLPRLPRAGHVVDHASAGRSHTPRPHHEQPVLHPNGMPQGTGRRQVFRASLKG
jgi:Na+/melibiose symporter-like transporter